MTFRLFSLKEQRRIFIERPTVIAMFLIFGWIVQPIFLHKHRDSQLQVWSAWRIMKNRVGSSWFEIQAKSSLLGAEKLRCLFILDQSKEISQDRERRRKFHRCIQTAIDSARTDSRSARRDSRLFFQTFRSSFVISWRISTKDSSLES